MSIKELYVLVFEIVLLLVVEFHCALEGAVIQEIYCWR